MGKALRKTLPKDFEALLDRGDFAKLTSALEACLPEARSVSSKQTALHFPGCSDELTRWLVGRGADVNALDLWGNTPLHSRINYGAEIDVLLELGADLHRLGSLGTPLHNAADKPSIQAAVALLDRGALVDAPNRDGHTPLELALMRCSNASLAEMAPMARLLLDRGAALRPSMKAAVNEIGERFEFHRENYALDGVVAASAALDALYAMFDVTPVPRRRMHDGVSPIRPKAKAWEKQHAELWNLLVPSSGPASTVQGEVVRIAGRIREEIRWNLAVNWDEAYRQMAQAFEVHVRSGRPLPDADLAIVASIVHALPRSPDLDELARLGVQWVLLNPSPAQLATPSYRR